MVAAIYLKQAAYIAEISNFIGRQTIFLFLPTAPNEIIISVRLKGWIDVSIFRYFRS